MHFDAYKAQDSPFDLDQLFKNLEADVFGDTEDQIMGQFVQENQKIEEQLFSYSDSSLPMDFDLSSIFGGGLQFGANMIRNSQGQQDQQDEMLSWLKDFVPDS